MKDKKTNWFVRILIIILSLFILVIIMVNFLFTVPKGEINYGIITLLLLVIVLVLSEVFDNFSIGKLISLNKENKVKDNNINILKDENKTLREEVINITSLITQQQSNTNIIGIPNNFSSGISVEKSTDEESKEDDCISNENKTLEKNMKKRINIKKMEELAINEFFEKNDLVEYKINFIRDAKLVTHFHNIDPISNNQPVFDGYFKYFEKELFFEVIPMRSYMMMRIEKIYVMLNKIYLYNKVKKADAVLILIFVNLDYKNDMDYERRLNEFSDMFLPAIHTGILNIIKCDMEEEDINNIYS